MTVFSNSLQPVLRPLVLVIPLNVNLLSFSIINHLNFPFDLYTYAWCYKSRNKGGTPIKMYQKAKVGWNKLPKNPKMDSPTQSWDGYYWTLHNIFLETSIKLNNKTTWGKTAKQSYNRFPHLKPVKLRWTNIS
jgi:hypothetical protein